MAELPGSAAYCWADMAAPNGMGDARGSGLILIRCCAEADVWQGASQALPAVLCNRHSCNCASDGHLGFWHSNWHPQAAAHHAGCALQTPAVLAGNLYKQLYETSARACLPYEGACC